MHSSTTLSTLSRQMYEGQRWRWKMVQSLRPYICPFGEVIDLVPSGSRVLDVGCGSGLFLLLLAKLGRIRAGFGFDVSKDAITAAREAAARMPEASVVQFAERAIEEGMPEGDWSVVSVVDVIHHVPPPYQQGFVQALCDATPVGARLVIKDMVAVPRWRALANRMHDLIMARQWVHHVGPDTVAGWVTDARFVCVHRSRSDMLWYGHWALVYERRAAADESAQSAR